jgi:hypothetical protein
MSHNVISCLILSHHIPFHLSYHVVIYHITLIYSSSGVTYGDLEKRGKEKGRREQKKRVEKEREGEDKQRRRGE